MNNPPGTPHLPRAAAPPHFRRLVRRRGDAGRDNLYRFFRHWLASRLVREQRLPPRHLPRAFAFGGAP